MKEKKEKKIYSTDLPELQSKLDEVQNRCTTRLIDAETCQKKLESIVWDRLDGMPKKYLAGTTIVLHSSTERLPRAYKYPAESTKVTFVHDGKGWVYFKADRSTLDSSNFRAHCAELKLTDAAKEWILNNLRRI